MIVTKFASDKIVFVYDHSKKILFSPFEKNNYPAKLFWKLLVNTRTTHKKDKIAYKIHQWINDEADVTPRK